MTVNVEQLIAELGEKLNSYLKARQIDNPAMLGIHTGGAWVAQHLHRISDIQHPLGLLDIAFYRDDFTHVGLHPIVKPSEIPFSIDGANLILVDDVIHTGRTIRAALNEIFDYGRPKTVTLVALVERAGHELPIKADVVAKTIELSAAQHVQLNGPESLELVITDE